MMALPGSSLLLAAYVGGFSRHCEERKRRSNPPIRYAVTWIASSQELLAMTWRVRKPSTRARLLSGLTRRARQHGFEPAADDGFGIAHDARHQFGTRRDVVDQALHLAGRPDALVGIAGGVDHLAARA